MKGLIEYIEEQPWEDTVIAPYVLVVGRFDQPAEASQFMRTRGPEPDSNAYCHDFRSNLGSHF